MTLSKYSLLNLFKIFLFPISRFSGIFDEIPFLLSNFLNEFTISFKSFSLKLNGNKSLFSLSVFAMIGYWFIQSSIVSNPINLFSISVSVLESKKSSIFAS